MTAVALTVCVGSFPSEVEATTANPTEFRPGVVFFCPKEPEKILPELERIKADGYNLLHFSAWPWDLPTAGSELEARAQIALEWCDKNDVEFFLLQNIQYGDQGSGATLDEVFGDKALAKSLCTDWARVLKGHKSVAGVLLGNEVEPLKGTSRDNPVWWAKFVAFLQKKYPSIESLNEAWASGFSDFSEIIDYSRNIQAEADISEFAQKTFGEFYGDIYESVFVPQIGKKLFCPKVNAYSDPYVFVTCEEFSMVSYDDVVSQYPPWRIKFAGDVGRLTGRPVFNSEIHLYHGESNFSGGPQATQFRYFLGVLNGELRTASYAWGHWDPSQAADIHAKTPEILANVKKFTGLLREIGAASPEWHVLCPLSMTRGDDIMVKGPRPEAQRIYARFGSQPAPWQFLPPEFLSTIKSGKLFIDESVNLSKSEWENVAKMPSSVEVFSKLSEVPKFSNDGQLITADLRRELESRLAPVQESDGFLAKDFRFRKTSYAHWGPETGDFSFPALIPKPEIRRVSSGDRDFIVAVNHSVELNSAPVAVELVEGTKKSVLEHTVEGLKPLNTLEIQLAPLEVRIFEVKK